MAQMDIPERYGQALNKGVKLCCTNSYDSMDLSYIPKAIMDANQGCGSPVTVAGLLAGQTVLDLGCGVGLDAFIASKKVGPKGKVIGIDANGKALELGRKSAPEVARNLGFANVSFEHSMIEELPLEDETVDVVTSNCVINLFDDKEKIFSEIHRVLKKGGHFTISDIFSNSPVPSYIANDSQLILECIGGAMSFEEGLAIMRRAGFAGLHQQNFRPYRRIDTNHFFSMTLTGYKPLVGKGSGYVVYRGPFRKVEDDFGRRYERGQAYHVDAKTLSLLNLTPYHSFIQVANLEEARSIKRIGTAPKPGPCRYIGQYAVLIGPFAKAVDDEGHVLSCRELEVCERTAKIYRSKHYSPFVSVFGKAEGKVSANSVFCATNGCC